MYSIDYDTSTSLDTTSNGRTSLGSTLVTTTHELTTEVRTTFASIISTNAAITSTGFLTVSATLTSTGAVTTPTTQNPSVSTTVLIHDSIECSNIHRSLPNTNHSYSIGIDDGIEYSNINSNEEHGIQPDIDGDHIDSSPPRNDHHSTAIINYQRNTTGQYGFDLLDSAVGTPCTDSSSYPIRSE